MVGFKVIDPILQSRLLNLIFVVALLFIIYRIVLILEGNVRNRMKERGIISASPETEDMMRRELSTSGEKRTSYVLAILAFLLAIFLLLML